MHTRMNPPPFTERYRAATVRKRPLLLVLTEGELRRAALLMRALGCRPELRVCVNVSRARDAHARLYGWRDVELHRVRRRHASRKQRTFRRNGTNARTVGTLNRALRHPAMMLPIPAAARRKSRLWIGDENARADQQKAEQDYQPPRNHPVHWLHCIAWRGWKFPLFLRPKVSRSAAVRAPTRAQDTRSRVLLPEPCPRVPEAPGSPSSCPVACN